MASVFAQQQAGKLPLDRQQATDLLKAQLARTPALMAPSRALRTERLRRPGQRLRRTRVPSAAMTRDASSLLLSRQGEHWLRICCSPSRRATRTNSAIRPTTTTPARNGRALLPRRSFKVDINGQQVLVSTITTPYRWGQFRTSPRSIWRWTPSAIRPSPNSNIYDGKGETRSSAPPASSPAPAGMPACSAAAPTSCWATAGSNTKPELQRQELDEAFRISVPIYCGAGHGTQLGHHSHPALPGGAGGPISWRASSPR